MFINFFSIINFYFMFFRYKGGPAIPRKLISQGVYVKNYCVEVYLLCLKLIDSRDESETTIRLSKKVFLSFLLMCFQLLWLGT